MIINKWNDDKKEYEPYEVPDNWKLPLISYDMDLPINCVNCGKEIKFGDGYTSKRYHTQAGMGYYECERCHFEYGSYLISRNANKDNSGGDL